ncbi:hypothetical protein J1N35_044629, partial [Gossypium stocksii]
MRIRGDFVRYCHTLLLSAPMMCKASGLMERTLWCSSIRVRNSEMKEGMEDNEK